MQLSKQVGLILFIFRIYFWVGVISNLFMIDFTAKITIYVKCGIILTQFVNWVAFRLIKVLFLILNVSFVFLFTNICINLQLKSLKTLAQHTVRRVLTRWTARSLTPGIMRSGANQSSWSGQWVGIKRLRHRRRLSRFVATFQTSNTWIPSRWWCNGRCSRDVFIGISWF